SPLIISGHALIAQTIYFDLLSPELYQRDPPPLRSATQAPWQRLNHIAHWHATMEDHQHFVVAFRTVAAPGLLAINGIAPAQGLQGTWRILAQRWPTCRCVSLSSSSRFCSTLSDHHKGCPDRRMGIRWIGFVAHQCEHGAAQRLGAADFGMRLEFGDRGGGELDGGTRLHRPVRDKQPAGTRIKECACQTR